MTMREEAKKGSTADWTVGTQPQVCPVCAAAYHQGCALKHVGNGSPESSAGLRLEFTCGAQVDFIRLRRGVRYTHDAIHSCFKIRTWCDEAFAQAVDAIGEIIGSEEMAKLACGKTN